MKVEGEQIFDPQDKGNLNRSLGSAPGMVKIMRSIAMFLLTINPIFIPPRFAIWDFRFWI